MKNDGWQKTAQSTMVCLMVAGLALASGIGHAVTAVGAASATVVDSVAVIVVVPPLPAVAQTPSALSGTVFTVDSFTGSLSTSGPLLRVGGSPAAAGEGGVVQASGAQGAAAAQGSAGAGAASPAAGTATVNVTRRADGSLVVSGGSGLTFAVSQPVNGAVNIEYN